MEWENGSAPLHSTPFRSVPLRSAPPILKYPNKAYRNTERKEEFGKVMKPFMLSWSLAIIVVPLFLSISLVTVMRNKTAMPAYEVFGVKIEKNPPQSKLTQLGVSTWPKWEGGPTKIPWSFTAEETMYILEGKVKVTVEESVGSFEIGAGDLIVFPKGMNITWEVTEALKKHYSLKQE